MAAVDSIFQKIKRSRCYVFERKEFDGIASYDQIGNSLNQLMDRGEIMKLGYAYTLKRE